MGMAGPAGMASDEREADLRLTIHPEPTEDERAAVVAALCVLLLGAGVAASAPGGGPLVRPSRWARAARMAALRGRPEPRPSASAVSDRGWRRG